MRTFSGWNKNHGNLEIIIAFKERAQKLEYIDEVLLRGKENKTKLWGVFNK